MQEPASPPSPASARSVEGAYVACEDLVRRADKDRYLAALFIPPFERRFVFALAAFNIEIARVREVISDAMPGEVRFQWWRDAIMGTARGDVHSHPVAGALLDCIVQCRLPRKALLDMIDARTFDLYDDPMPSLNALEGYCGETASALFQLSALCLAGGADPHSARCAGHAGVAYALTGLMRALPYHARRGQCYLPLDIMRHHGVDRDDVVNGKASDALAGVLLALRQQAEYHASEARRAIVDIHESVRAAFLPMALVPAYLRALERTASRPFTRLADVAQWRRQLALWQASRR
ncbi:phytoene/squalene synthase family protein [Candidatus Raskinella chloraquaticus]|jgi:15-cis-phytoene synthase|uniref:phytoene/squalene synthase family protein n=1 Tax=Candidatus Raskinella chloraquaticus TaxID=1951219 RepID=UPI0026A8F46C